MSEKQARKIEDAAQKNDAIQNAVRLRTKYYEYTSSIGKVYRGESGANAAGGTYRAEYSEKVAQYSKMSTAFLEKERSRLKGISNSQYQQFARSAASRSASQVSSFSSADTQIKMIEQILRRRKRK